MVTRWVQPTAVREIAVNETVREIFEFSWTAQFPLSDEATRPEAWGAERDVAFPARSTPGRDGLFGKGEDLSTFGILDGP